MKTSFIYVNKLITPHDYRTRIKKIAEEVAKKFEDSENYTISSKSHYYTLTYPERISGLSELIKDFLPEIGKIAYTKEAKILSISIYRTPDHLLSGMRNPEWGWHYDNSLDSVCKLNIYLNDVTEDNAPMEYLVNNEIPIRFGYTTSKRKNISRKMFDTWLREGCRTKKITGLQGTTIFFDNNIVHNKDIAKRGYRDIVITKINER